MVSAGGGDSWKYFCPAVEGTAIVCLPASDFDVVVVRTSFSQTTVKASMSHLMSHHKTLLTKITGFSQRIMSVLLSADWNRNEGRRQEYDRAAEAMFEIRRLGRIYFVHRARSEVAGTLTECTQD